MKVLRFIVAILAIAVCAMGAAAKPKAADKNRIVVSKKDLTLAVLSPKGDTLLFVPVCVGANKGNKTAKGDRKTPEGTFPVWMIEDSSKWTYDFHDGKGKRKGAYGPWFIRLKVPGYRSIGIHGTCFPETVGTRSSEGCVRMRNEDVQALRNLITYGSSCTILPD